MSGWQPIETAPKDGAEVLCYWAGQGGPELLVWKTNPRIVSAHERGTAMDLDESYFGDPVEMDDYDLAEPGKGPTHWLPIPSPPSAPVEER